MVLPPSSPTFLPFHLDIILDDVVTTEPKNPLWMTKGNNGKKNERSSLTGGTPNYGSMPVPSGSSKKKKKGRGGTPDQPLDSGACD